MTTYYSVAGTSGAHANWEDASTWASSHGGAAGAGVPGTGDNAYVEDSHYVDINNALAIKSIIVGMNGYGYLTVNNDITFDDIATPQLVIYTSSGTGLSTNATHSSPRYFKSASGGNPTNFWRFYGVDSTASTDSRVIDLDYCIFTGNMWGLHNDTYEMWFNYGNQPRITSITPLDRVRKVSEHFCEGRDYGRVYDGGGYAGVVQIAGVFKWASNYPTLMRKAMDSGQRLCFTSQYVHLPICRIESVRFKPKPGSLYLDFEATLVESH